MKILGLDTSTMMASCALMEGIKLLGEYSLNQDMSHSENLLPMIKEVMDNLDLRPEDIDLYGVALGPGSFTGLRIGVSTMKSLAHLFDKPIVGVGTLEALAYNLPYNEIVVPMIDARRNRVYTGIYSWENGNIKPILEASALDIEDLISRLDKYEKIVFNGDGSVLYRELLKERLKEKALFAPIGQNNCRATSVCELAKASYDEGRLDDYYTIAPDYLRPSQAERELKKKQG